MGGKDFCGFLQHLQAASAALSAQELPTLHALSSLAAEFQPVSTSADSPGMLLKFSMSSYIHSPLHTLMSAVSAKVSCWNHNHSTFSEPFTQYTEYSTLVLCGAVS